MITALFYSIFVLSFAAMITILATIGASEQNTSE